jgi:hypothetical protein
MEYTLQDQSYVCQSTRLENTTVPTSVDGSDSSPDRMGDGSEVYHDATLEA